MLSELTSRRDDFGTIVTGLVTNQCGRKFSIVSMKFRMLDSIDHATLGYANCVLDGGLSMAERRRFRARALVQSKLFQLAEIDAF